MESYYESKAEPAPQNPPPPHNPMAIDNLIHPPVPMPDRIQPLQALNQPATHFPSGASFRRNSSPPMHIPPHSTSPPPGSQSDTNVGNIFPSVAFDANPHPHDPSQPPWRRKCDNCGTMYASDSNDMYRCMECIRSPMMVIFHDTNHDENRSNRSLQHDFPRPLGQATQRSVSPQHMSSARHLPSSSTAPTAHPDGNSSDEGAGAGDGAVSLHSCGPFFGNETQSTPPRASRATTQKYDGSGFRLGHIPKSPMAPVASKDPTTAKKTRVARRRRAIRHQEQESLRVYVEEELPQRLQQSIEEEAAWKAETEEVKRELGRIKRSVSEAKNGLASLHGVEVAQKIAGEIERQLTSAD